jgi:hypothetical protein
MKRVTPPAVPSKKARRGLLVWAAKPDAIFRLSVCAQSRRTEPLPFSLKQQRCPHCGCTETLNRHSKLYGNDPQAAVGCSERGQRVWCSDRGERGGCGRSFCIFIADVLPRHTLRASLLWPWLSQWLAGLSLRAAAQKLAVPFALETLYRLRRTLRRGLEGLRSLLFRQAEPPRSEQANPLAQTLAHLQSVFPHSQCPPADFQLRYQRPFLG